MKQIKPIFHYDKETGCSTCVIETKYGKFSGTACCHPDDMDMESYTSIDLEKRGIKERKRTSTVKANKATGGVENTSMDNLFTSVEKTQPDAKEVAKTQNKAYSLQEWMTEYKKLLLQVENTDIEDVRFNSILDDGIKLFESFPKNKGNYQRKLMQCFLH